MESRISSYNALGMIKKTDHFQKMTAAKKVLTRNKNNAKDIAHHLNQILWMGFDRWKRQNNVREDSMKILKQIINNEEVFSHINIC